MRVVPWGTTVVVTELDAVKTVFCGDSETWHAGESFQMLEPVLGERSLILREDPAHLDARKKLLPYFGKVARERYAKMIEDLTLEEIERWPRDRPFELRPAMESITLEVILRAIIGTRDRERIETLRHVVTRAIALKPITVIGWLIPSLQRFGPWRKHAEGVERARSLFREEVREREADLARNDGHDDILTHLLRTDAFEEDDLIDQLVTLMLAGHETTTSALAWSFERLLRHPDALAQAREDDEYLSAAIKEGLRLRPVFPALARGLATDAEVAGYQLPAGTTVMVGASLVHLSPELYDEPEIFRPERFLDGKAHTYDWLPFGGGNRRCLAASFAFFEMQLIMRTVLANVDIRPDRPDDEPVQSKLIMLVPRRGARVVCASSS
jgi:cytochrome P450